MPKAEIREAEPATMAAENVRLLIIISVFLLRIMGIPGK
jgi:hypothetical protein